MERSGRSPKTLPDHLHHQLNMYALAASATGAGVLALAQPAEARIVYTQTHQQVDRANGFVNIDLNHDGKVDFALFLDLYSSVGSGIQAAAYGSGTQSNQIWRAADSSWAADLPAGTRVGSRHRRSPKPHAVMEGWGCRRSSKCGYGGPWVNVKNKYLGLAFLIKGQTHYGWARVSATLKKDGDFYRVRAVLTGYAYETIPNKAIITGETKGHDPVADQTTTLGRLALGAR
jgi:hypothetical protein